MQIASYAGQLIGKVKVHVIFKDAENLSGDSIFFARLFIGPLEACTIRGIDFQ